MFDSLGEDLETLLHYTELFETGLSPKIEAIYRGILEKSSDKLEHPLHSLKGGLANFYQPYLMRLFFELNTYIKEEDFQMAKLKLNDLEQCLMILLPEKIVIIDDSPESLNLMMMFIKRSLLCNVKGFSSEFDAIKSLNDFRPDLIVLDVFLEKMDGLKLARTIEDLSFFNGPILFVSSADFPDPDFLKSLKERSFFLKKPFQKNLFIETVTRLLT